MSSYNNKEQESDEESPLQTDKLHQIQVANECVFLYLTVI